MIALISLFLNWKANKGKDSALVTDGVACVTAGESRLLSLLISLFFFFFKFLPRLVTGVLLVVKRTK